RLHHDRNKGYGNKRFAASFCLLMDERPVSLSTLPILSFLRWIVERELDVMKGAQVFVFQHRNAMPVGSDRKLDRFRSQICQDCPELGMHSVFAGAEIHRGHGQSLHHCLHLVEREAIRSSWIAVTECTTEITFVGKAEPQSNAIRRLWAGFLGLS